MRETRTSMVTVAALWRAEPAPSSTPLPDPAGLNGAGCLRSAASRPPGGRQRHARNHKPMRGFHRPSTVTLSRTPAQLRPRADERASCLGARAALHSKNDGNAADGFRRRRPGLPDMRKGTVPGTVPFKLLARCQWRYCWIRVVRNPASPYSSMEACQDRNSSTVSL